jgi:hypothetical protein
MRKGRTIAIGSMLALCGVAEVANASSRFEARNEAPLAAEVALHFTIVIPEILTLRVDRKTITRGAPKAQLALTVPSTVTHPDADDADGAPMPRAHASTNAGTLAIGTAVSTNDAGAYGALTAPQIRVSPALSVADTQQLAEAAPPALSLNASPAIFLIALP